MKTHTDVRALVWRETKAWAIAAALTAAFLSWWIWMFFYSGLKALSWDWLLPFMFGTVIARVILWFVQFLRRLWLTVQDDYSVPPADAPHVRRVILQLRLRASRLRIIAGFSLVLIFASLAGGLFIFSRAESSASRAELERSQYLSQRLRSYRQELQELDDQIATVTDDATRNKLQSTRKALQTRVDSLVDDIARSTQTSKDSQTTFLVTVLSTKIGSVLTLLFLVQILVTLYRYNTKLASFYDGRADTLQLTSLDHMDDLRSISAILATERLDFGKVPTTPAQHALEITKELFSARTKS